MVFVKMKNAFSYKIICIYYIFIRTECCGVSAIRNEREQTFNDQTYLLFFLMKLAQSSCVNKAYCGAQCAAARVSHEANSWMKRQRARLSPAAGSRAPEWEQFRVQMLSLG